MLDHNLRRLFQIALLLICTTLLLALTTGKTLSVPLAKDDMSGRVKAEINGKTLYFPTLKIDIASDIQGDLATVTVTQTFANPTSSPLNATYLFPLNKDAAVYSMVMKTNNEIVIAQIKEKQEARREFETAKQQGKTASLLDQHRPNMFTQSLANLMPGQPIEITLKYTQAVPRVDGKYELVLPLVVGPRYKGSKPQANTVQSDDNAFPNMWDDKPGLQKIAQDKQSESSKTQDTPKGQWVLEPVPDTPPVSGLTIPDTIEKDRVSITINLASGVAIKNVTSSTHDISVDGDNGTKTITLANAQTIDNADFVLRYQLAGQKLEAGLLTHHDKSGGYFSLLVEPPAAPSAKDITAREMVFVLDTSGSMSGNPMKASKIFMRYALNTLRENDYFRIIQFNNAASEFTNAPVRATSQNIVAGLTYVDSLTVNGGTEIPTAINKAFEQKEIAGTKRIVTFLTDGYIGNEGEVLRLIARKIGAARIHAFGVGTSVNRFLIGEMARKGRGFARFIDPTESDRDAAISLAQKLQSPVLTDIHIDWGDLDPKDVTPTLIPDLFAGNSLRIQGRFNKTGTHTVFINGLVNGRKARLPLKLELTDENSTSNSKAIPLTWARSQIADQMRLFTTPKDLRAGGESDKMIKRKVTELGLRHALMTQWTSFVAVSKKVVNPEPHLNKNVETPHHMVKGITEKAYGTKGLKAIRMPSPTPPSGPLQHANNAPMINQKVTYNFQGGSTPEPSTIAGMLLMFLMMLWLINRSYIRNS